MSYHYEYIAIYIAMPSARIQMLHHVTSVQPSTCYVGGRAKLSNVWMRIN